MNKEQVIAWLLEGDVSIQYQVCRDLLDEERKDLQGRISREGWGKEILERRNANRHWGMRFYQPKWISTHYTLLDLRNLNLDPRNEIVKDTLELVLSTHIATDGGIRLGPSTAHRSDVCVNGMFLNYASYFRAEEVRLRPVVDSILAERMPDGGFNCRTTRSGARHSSLHSSISVLEGFVEFLKAGYGHRRQEILKAKQSTEEFILQHRLYKSDRTGEIIRRDFIKLPYPGRWRYDILRALDYFQYAERAWDSRMQAAMDVLLDKRRPDGTWTVQAAHPGQVHVHMEQAGKPSRWNTLRALRVLKHFGFWDQ